MTGIFVQSRTRLRDAIAVLRDVVMTPVYDVLTQVRSKKEAQLLLMLHYREAIVRGQRLPDFADVEFRAYSQNGEDGILLYIFALIGSANRKVVEICCGDGIECNSANLIINHGWSGLLIDANRRALKRGRRFYRRCGDTFLLPPKLVESWVTAENVNDLLQDNGFTGEIDLLSLDLDGMDYWIWNAIEVVRPRVVVVEQRVELGPEVSVTAPYLPTYRAKNPGKGLELSGASAAAFVSLAKTKGYRLVGAQRLGFNAFFVREGIGEDLFPAVPIHSSFQHCPGPYPTLEQLVSAGWVLVGEP